MYQLPTHRTKMQIQAKVDVPQASFVPTIIDNYVSKAFTFIHNLQSSNSFQIASNSAVLCVVSVQLSFVKLFLDSSFTLIQPFKEVVNYAVQIYCFLLITQGFVLSFDLLMRLVGLNLSSKGVVLRIRERVQEQVRSRIDDQRKVDVKGDKKDARTGERQALQEK